MCRYSIFIENRSIAAETMIVPSIPKVISSMVSGDMMGSISIACILNANRLCARGAEAKSEFLFNASARHRSAKSLYGAKRRSDDDTIPRIVRDSMTYGMNELMILTILGM